MKRTYVLGLAVLLMLTFLSIKSARIDAGSLKEEVRNGTALRFLSQPTPTPRASVTITINPDGSFDPQNVQIRPGQTVRWQNLRRTDAIVRITEANAAPPANVCAPFPAHRFNGHDPDEFTGPKRLGVSGIFALGPNGPGLLQVAESTPCQCEDDDRSCTPILARANGNKLCPEEGENYRFLDETWNNPDITGVIIRLNWSDIQKDIGGEIQYVWSDLDRLMNTAVSHGKLFTLDVRAGSGGTPPWIFSNYPERPGPVTPLYFKDWGEGQAPPDDGCGFSMVLGSPTHVAYRNLYVAMIKALAQHVASDSRWFQALAHVRISGANFTSSEARVPKRCSDYDEDGKLDVVSFVRRNVTVTDPCFCNTRRWAEASYTPEGLYLYYRTVENAIYEAFFRRKSMGYQLIQDGFPKVESHTNFMGDTLTDQAGNPMIVPVGTDGDDLEAHLQTETILRQGQQGLFSEELSRPDAMAIGAFFVAQHSGLLPLPNDLDQSSRCVQQQVVGADKRAKFPLTYQGNIPNIDDGCPNPWAVRHGLFANQITGFQTTNVLGGVNSPEKVESALWNLTLNSNAVFIELYEERLWQIFKLLRSGSLAGVLDPTRASLNGNPAPYSKNLYTWGEELHSRRRQWIVNNPQRNLPDPFPEIYDFTFSPRTLAPRTYYYINPSQCLRLPLQRRTATITIR